LAVLSEDRCTVIDLMLLYGQFQESTTMPLSTAPARSGRVGWLRARKPVMEKRNKKTTRYMWLFMTISQTYFKFLIPAV
jgi:hypothetical protein